MNFQISEKSPYRFSKCIYLLKLQPGIEQKFQVFEPVKIYGNFKVISTFYNFNVKFWWLIINEWDWDFTITSRCTQRNSKKIVWYLYRNRQIEQWNLIEDPKINIHSYECLIFDEELKTIQWINTKHLQRKSIYVAIEIKKMAK